MILFLQAALNQRLKSIPDLVESTNQISSYNPVDQKPPYIYIADYDFQENGSEIFWYGRVDIVLVVRETGLLHTSHLNKALVKMLGEVLSYKVPDGMLTFIIKINNTTIEVGRDLITKTYLLPRTFKN